MNPASRFSASLLCSLLLWAPTMLACLRGEVDLTAAALRYVAAFVAASVAFRLLGRLIDRYATQAEAIRVAEDARTLLRRAEDQLRAAEAPATGVS